MVTDRDQCENSDQQVSGEGLDGLRGTTRSEKDKVWSLKGAVHCRGSKRLNVLRIFPRTG